MTTWDPTRAKAHFRLTAQRLGQLRDRKDAQGQVVSRDISILLQQGNETLARAKAQRLIQDEIMGDFLENLEMQIGVLLERFGELDLGAPSPAAVEAASTIIFAAPHVDSRDLQTCRELLGVRLGPHFLHTASTNRDQYASAKVVHALSAPPASAADMHTYLADIARSFHVQWSPEHRPNHVLDALSEILDRSGGVPAVDLPRLRNLCAYGIPETPSWLRPRIWRLLLGTLPTLKASWDGEARKQRESYYDLVRRLLEPFSNLPPPTSPLATLDAALTDAIKDLFRVPASLFSGLEGEPEGAKDCPLDPQSDSRVRISCALNLDIRLKAINRDGKEPDDLPEIRLEAEAEVNPEISITSPDAKVSRPSLTLVPSQSLSTGGAHPKHASALIRLLYIHSCLNPANHSPHMASLLIPLYSVLLQEVESPDIAHIEADTFWLFEAMVGEFAELEDEEGGNQWMRRFGERLQWADPELSADLHLKGLDPGLPHYSYRWLAPLLTHTLPLSSVLSVWDVLFARPMTTRDVSPKLDALLDTCTSMLIRARGPLFRLGKPGRRSPSLWAEENSLMGPPSPVRAWELNDAFIEGMSLLQMYPLESAGGVDSVIQTAVELGRRREEEKSTKTNHTLGSRWSETIWRGLTNQGFSPLPSPDASDSEEEEEEEEEESDEGGETEPVPVAAGPKSPGITSRLATAVWKGITNQSAMEAPPSPVSPFPPSSPTVPSPSPSPTSSQFPASPKSPTPSTSSGSTSLWSYAEKLRDSDTAASLAKVSTNWRVKALQAWGTRKPGVPSPEHSPSQARPRSESVGLVPPQEVADAGRRGSLPNMSRSEAYSPPPRPAYFRPPRDSMLPQPRRSPLSSPTSPDSFDGSQAKSIRDSIASLAGLAGVSPSKPPPKSGPRPLLLNTSSLLTKPTPVPPRGPSARSRSSLQPTSISSISEVVAPRRHDSHSDWESDTTESRVIPLNRRSVSPMAPLYRTGQGRPNSSSSEKGQSGQDLFLNRNRGTSSPSGHSDGSTSRGWGRVDAPDSPVTLPASPPPHTPPPSISTSNGVAVSGSEPQRGSVVLSESNVHVLEAPAQARKLVRKKTPPPSRTEYNSDSSAPPDAPPRSPRTRSKRAPQQLTNLHIQQPAPLEVSTNSLAPPEWPDDHDNAVTPRASTFNDYYGENSASSTSPVSPEPSPRRTRKLSGDGREPRARKISASSHSPRSRKVSETKTIKQTESGAEEGDDEGYDELLSAYESEDSAGHSITR
ncbi:regulator of Vps4 activity in the MVB pathway-domain-containing protein [Gloeopeniophorella convolvens]|nr:regulator of Vps4 activity in the MVB pathway-domain-containing protein [Gloeopeniophorella convolvens]